jgi:hypothetical protein
MLNYPTTWSEQQIHDAYAANEQKRLEHYLRAEQAYKGDLPDSLKVKQGGLNDNIKVSKCRVIVDTGVAFLFGDNITFDIDKEKGRSAAEQYLDDLWAVNRKMTLLTKLATNGGKFGHAFLKMVPGYALTSPYPRLIVLDPANVNVTWDDDDIENVVAYRIQWKAIDPKTGRGVSKKQELTRQDNGTWLIVDYIMREGYVSARWEEVSRVTWLYSWPPVIDCQNIPVPNEFYGESDIPNDIIDLNRSRNFTLSNWQRIIKFQAHQRMWGKGFREDQIKLGADDVFIIGSEAGQLNSIDPPTNLAGLEMFDRRIDDAIHEAARTPSIATGKVENVGPLSGVALKILYGPLEQKTQVKRRTYGDMLNELNRRLLELAGYGPTNTTSIAWPSVVPLDEQAERATAQADLDMGVASKSTIASKLGYDYETEQQHMAEEAAAVEGDESALPTQDEADVLKTTFEAGSAAVDMGIPLDLFLKKYLAWTPAEISEVTQAADAEAEANALEARERMDAMREGGLIGQQQPGQGQDGEVAQGSDGIPNAH